MSKNQEEVRALTGHLPGTRTSHPKHFMPLNMYCLQIIVCKLDPVEDFIEEREDQEG